MNTANAPTATPSPAFDAETLAGLNAAFGTKPARTSDGGEQVDTTAIRAILRASAHSHGHAGLLPDPGHTHVEHDEPGQFQPFTDLRAKPAAPAIYGVTLPGDGGPDAVKLPADTRPFAERIADLAAQYPAPKPDVCANWTPGVMLPDCMTDEQFEAALAAMSEHWKAAIDTFLAAWTAAQAAS